MIWFSVHTRLSSTPKAGAGGRGEERERGEEEEREREGERERENRRTLVYNACTAVVFHIRITHNAEGAFLLQVDKVLKQRHVSLALVRAPEAAAQHGVLITLLAPVFVQLTQPALQQNVCAATFLIENFRVFQIGVHAEGAVGGEGPGSCCHHHHLSLWVVFEREGDEDVGVALVLVVGGSLEVGWDEFG